MYDFSKNNFSKSSEAGYTFKVKTAWGEDTDFLITVRGEQSKTVRDASKTQYNEDEMKKRAAKQRGTEYNPSLDELEDSLIEACTVRIISWTGIGSAGVELPFTKENASLVLRGNDHIQTQILTESRLASNFRPK